MEDNEELLIEEGKRVS